MVEAPPAAGATTPPLLCKVRPFPVSRCSLVHLMPARIVFPYILLYRIMCVCINARYVIAFPGL